ncbi:MAG: glycosyltransferase family 39 protein, partial [bacterium]
MSHPRAAAALVALVFAAASAAVMHGPGERSHRIPDGVVSRFQAQSIASGRWIAPAPPEAEAFKLSMVMVREGKRFGKDYPGFPMLLAPAEVVGVDWLVNPLLGGLLVAGTFFLGRALYDAATGLAAAVVTASSPMLLQLATSYLNTLACGCLLLGAALALLRARSPGSRRWAALGGFLFGWAVATRPFTGALLLLPLSLLLATARPGRRFGSTCAFGVAALPWGIGMLVWNVLLSGDPLTTPYQLWRPTNELGFGETPHGTFGPGEAWKETLGLVRRFGDRFVPLPLGGLLLVAVPLLGARRAGRRGAGLAAAALVLVAGHSFYAGIGAVAAMIGGSRYYVEALPACAVLFACPLGALAARGRAGRWLFAG